MHKYGLNPNHPNDTKLILNAFYLCINMVSIPMIHISVDNFMIFKNIFFSLY